MHRQRYKSKGTKEFLEVCTYMPMGENTPEARVRIWLVLQGIGMLLNIIVLHAAGTPTLSSLTKDTWLCERTFSTASKVQVGGRAVGGLLL